MFRLIVLLFWFFAFVAFYVILNFDGGGFGVCCWFLVWCWVCWLIAVLLGFASV